ncbi:hypothetical protein N0V88_006792 [Collariella sp. IMI 366227]|nr:hypothetical protein N0V88_006792 [Collariella sp. IMI 366227]
MPFLDEPKTPEAAGARPRRPANPQLTPEQSTFWPDIRADDLECPHNPTKIDRPYYKFMIANGSKNAYQTRKMFDMIATTSWIQRPLFCFQRFGRTETRLPDGRIVYIAGEHEDFYDPDFYIYNDVVVVSGKSVKSREAMEEEEYEISDSDESDYQYYSDPEVAELQKKFWEKEKEEQRVREEKWKKEKMEENLWWAAAAEGARPEDIEIYSYPADVFPRTDYHTATYYKDEKSGAEYIFIIGRTYGSPELDVTLTHRLDLEDFSIPELVEDTIKLTVGEDKYVLDLSRMVWAKV